MGDEDDSLTLHRKGILAMAKLAEQHAGILKNGYHSPPKSEEELLRDKHPTLNDAWETYQSILTLCKVEKK